MKKSATYIFDLDGVFFYYGTMKPVSGAVELVSDLRNQGHSIVFMTARRRKKNDPPHLTIEKTERALSALGVEYDALVEGVGSPRIVINDEGAIAVNHIRDAPIDRHALTQWQTPLRSDLVKRTFDSLCGVAWTAWKYNHSGDADDYVQTILLARSIIESGGFDHRDLVSRYRAPVNYRLEGVDLNPSGIHEDYHGQIRKLLLSDDPLYLASDGVSDGAAMKITAAAAFYCRDFGALVENTDRIVRVTHASPEARFAAVMVAIRLRQVILGIDPDNIELFVSELEAAERALDFERPLSFFMSRVYLARDLVSSDFRPKKLLHLFCRKIGMGHLAWSTPIAACFWSFHRDKDFSKWMRDGKEKRLYLPRNRFGYSKRIVARMLEEKTWDEDVAHLEQIGQFDEYQASHGYHWGTGLDVDTFFSIAFSILAARHGTDSIADEVPKAIECFGDDLLAIAESLISNETDSLT